MLSISSKVDPEEAKKNAEIVLTILKSYFPRIKEFFNGSLTVPQYRVAAIMVSGIFIEWSIGGFRFETQNASYRIQNFWNLCEACQKAQQDKNITPEDVVLKYLKFIHSKWMNKLHSEKPMYGYMQKLADDFPLWGCIALDIVNSLPERCRFATENLRFIVNNPDIEKELE